MSRVPGWIVTAIIVVVCLFVLALIVHALGGFKLHIGFFKVSVSMGKAVLLR